MAKKEEVGAGLAVPQVTVLDGIKAVNAQIAKLKHINESVYKTTGRVTGFGNKIQDETSIPELIKMFSSVKGRGKAYDEAAEELLGRDATYPIFKLEGGSVDEFKHDITLRIDIISNKERLDELTAIKKDFTELMDRDDRMQLLVEKMKKFTKPTE